ncbi:MAG: ribonuclease III [Thermodesulfovibrionales bacterium]|nr:ribonuclease III [Thermodesulfovibrionales bacterium]
MPASSLKNFQELENSLGYSFKNRALLMEALTHKSFHNERPEDSPFYNERLEFLGDAVLGLIISEYLFRRFPEEDESRLASLKAYLVKESVLFEIAKGLFLGEYLLLGKGEEHTGGRQKSSILADCLEALIGAVFLDGGLEDARELISRLFRRKFEELTSADLILDPKSELQKLSLERYGKLPEYKIIAEHGAEHKKVFTVNIYINGEFFGTGSGKSKKEAQTEAAKIAIKKMHEKY